MSTSSVIEFFNQDFSRADLISLAALAVAGLSAIYARRQSEEARKARLSAQKEARRPQRLEVYRAMQEYCRYCSTYYTAYLSGGTTGTRDLAGQISSFEREMEKAAIHDMPEVVAESKLLQSMGWRLQRHIDRLGMQPTVIARGTEAKSDEQGVHDLVDLFAKRRAALREVFASYLESLS